MEQPPAGPEPLEELEAQVRQRRRRRSVARTAAVASLVAIAVTAGLVWSSSDHRDQIETAGAPGPEPRTGAIDPEDGGRERPEPRTVPVVVAAGEIDGVRWHLSVYESDVGLCVDLTGGGAFCGFDVPAQHAVGLGVTSTVTEGPTGAGSVRLEAAYGPVGRDVARIAIRLVSGKVVKASPVGHDAGFAVNFYVAHAPTDIPAGDAIHEVVVYRANGNELDRLELACPIPDQHPVGTCRSPERRS